MVEALFGFTMEFKLADVVAMFDAELVVTDGAETVVVVVDVVNDKMLP